MHMTIKLIDGSFSTQDALDIITGMIHVKIRFHENKIARSANEEDIKSREKRIKELQRQLYDCRQYLEGRQQVDVASSIAI